MRDNFPSRDVVERVKREYPKGTRVELVSMDDQYTHIPPGTQGTVSAVDDIGTIFVDWDTGSGLGVAYGVDVVRKVV